MANPNPKDSIKSTWRTGDRSEWTLIHWILELSNALPVARVPVHSKQDKIPYLSQWPQHLWILFHAFIPLALHQAWLSLTGHSGLGKLAVFVVYFGGFSFSVIRTLHIFRRLAHIHGFLDGDVHHRDGVPDAAVGKVVASLPKSAGARVAMAVHLTYSRDEAPLTAMTDVKWWLWLCLATGIYGIILDFWFYWYHRAMHDIAPLWKFHRTHHLTKHPNVLMTIFGDHEQEFFDMAGVPLMTYLTFWALGMPLGFYDWWICHQYVVYAELGGHNGVRLYASAPSTLGWLLKAFDVDIITEDHDLHHRTGYRKSHNYGKQTRLWDRVFGTCHERIEAVATNIDYVNEARIPFAWYGLV